MSSPIDRPRCRLGPGLEAPPIEEALACLGRDPEVERLLLFGCRARGEARADSDLDLLISDAATAAHWAGSRRQPARAC